MPDPELVAYIARNLADHPPEDIRASLLDEGLAAEEIDAALASALQPGGLVARATPALPSFVWLLFFCALISLLLAGIWRLSTLENSKAAAAAKAAPAPAPAPQLKLDSPPETPAAPPGYYSGHYGYSLKIPTGMTASEGLCDLRAQTEVLLVHPAGMSARTLSDPEAFLRAGGVRLEVSPRKTPWINLKADYARRSAGGRYSVESAPGLALPAFQVRSPNGRLETFLDGKYTLYRFTSLKASKGVLGLPAGLSETAPRERMQGILWVAQDPKAGRIYWHESARAFITVPPGFARLAPVAKGLRYDFAYKHEREAFEVRLRFDSTAEATRDYQSRKTQPCWRDNSCPMQDPDAANDDWASAMAMGLTEASFSFDPIPDRLAREDFAADWGMLSPSFELSLTKPFNYPYRFGILMLLHRNGVGNCNVMFLSQNTKTLNERSNDPAVIYGVKFARP